MEYCISKYLDSTTGRYEIMIVDNLCNVIPTCFYLNSHLHHSYGDKTNATRETYAYILMFIYRYFQAKNINIVNRVSSGLFLTNSEIDDFAFHCKRLVDKDQNSGSGNILNLASFSDKKIDNLMQATAHTENTASSHTRRLRLKLFLRYVQFLTKYHHYDYYVPESVNLASANFEKSILDVISEIGNDDTVTKDPCKKVIGDEEFFKLLKIIKPSDPDNPWQGAKLRNSLMILLLIETGIRLGAMLKMKTFDIVYDWDNPRIMITRVTNRRQKGKRQDKRRKAPAQKTKAHTSAISSELAKLLKLYIETERIKYPESENHEYVFIAEQGSTAGKPLSKDAAYGAVKTLGKAVGCHLHPHKFRHKWNEIFSTNAKKLGYTIKQIDDLRKYAMGWSENSQMAGTYNRFEIAMMIHEISAKNQNDTVPAQGYI
ncbi:site-specific integrase [Photobacterium sp. Alg240-V54]|uniref:tyrosine-type recombinase/integrase n=1 Tax=Photobacterium sp. Alg240-V54 TaxID=2305995 RepID=UPI0013D23DC8|nr:site-specific integrase [Photobacterium sp. Alg240-V54]